MVWFVLFMSFSFFFVVLSSGWLASYVGQSVPASITIFLFNTCCAHVSFIGHCFFVGDIHTVLTILNSIVLLSISLRIFLCKTNYMTPKTPSSTQGVLSGSLVYYLYIKNKERFFL